MLRHPSHGTVVAYIALFVALGGTSIAAVTLAKNSVLSKTIKDGQVKTADLGAGAVTTAKVKDGSLLAGDFAAGQLLGGAKGDKGDPGLPGVSGTNGAAGAKGDKGDKGDPGTNGANGADGDPGTNGTNGLDGAAIRVRARKSGGNVTVPAGSMASVPLSPSTWTQAANETDLVLVGVSFTPPMGCTSMTQGGITLSVQVSGATLLGGNGGALSVAHSTGATTASYIAGFILDPIMAPSRTVTLSVQNGCQGMGENYTINDAAINVGAFL